MTLLPSLSSFSLPPLVFLWRHDRVGSEATLPVQRRLLPHAWPPHAIGKRRGSDDNQAMPNARTPLTKGWSRVACRRRSSTPPTLLAALPLMASCRARQLAPSRRCCGAPTLLAAPLNRPLLPLGNATCPTPTPLAARACPCRSRARAPHTCPSS